MYNDDFQKYLPMLYVNHMTTSKLDLHFTEIEEATKIC